MRTVISKKTSNFAINVGWVLLSGKVVPPVKKRPSARHGALSIVFS
jgi:hypothetical protein